MKKPTLLFLLIIYGLFSFAQDPQLSWKIMNDQFTEPGNEFDLDIYMKADQPGSWLRELNLFISYRHQSFGYFIESNNNLDVSLIGFLDDPGVPGNPFYPLYLIEDLYDHDSTVLGIWINTTHPGRFGGEYFTFLGTNFPYNIQMPDTYSPALHFEIDVVNPNEKFRFVFMDSLMNGQQYHTDTLAPVPLHYDSINDFENNLYCRPKYYFACNCWDGSVSDDWFDYCNWLNGWRPPDASWAEIPGNYLPYPIIALPGAEAIQLDLLGELTINHQGNLTIYNTLNNYGQLKILSAGNDSISAIGSFIGYIEHFDPYGEVQMERILTSSCPVNDNAGDSWNYVASPVPNAVSGLFQNCYLKAWDEYTGQFFDVDPNSTMNEPLNVMQGYITEYVTNDTLPEFKKVTFTNDLFNDGPLNIPVTAIGPPIPSPPYNNGWNLVGNPYPSSIDWEEVSLPANIDPTVYYWDEEEMIYYTYTQGVGGSGSQFIPPTQGFFIHATANDVFSLDNSVRTHSGQETFYKSSPENTLVLESGKDETRIVFNQDASNGFDRSFDAYKLFSETASAQLYSISDEICYATNSLPSCDYIDVGFKSASAGQYAISAEHIGDDFDYAILKDKLTGIETNLLTMPEYTFIHSSDHDPERFLLIFEPLSVEEVDQDFVEIYRSGRGIIVKISNDDSGSLSVYALTGQLLSKHKVGQGTSRIAVDLAPGVYIVRLSLNEGNYSTRLIMND